MKVRAVVLCLALAVGKLFPAECQNIPPSPKAAQLIRYAEIPVDYCTGVPSISVPIYTINTGKISLPINLSYHSAGIKVRDVPGDAGLGWVLNAGGVISRSILGYPDEQVPGIVNKSPYKTKAAIDDLVATVPGDGLYGNPVGDNVSTELKMVMDRGYDNQSDRYAYNFNGHVGFFRFDYLSDAVKTIPYKPIVVTRNGLGLNAKFKILDESGFAYYFDSTESTINSAGTGGISSWLLNRIESADGQEQVRFYYSQGDWISELEPSQTIVSGLTYQIANNYALDGGQYVLDYSDNSTISDHKTMRLDSIVGLNEIVRFEYAGDRIDKPQTRLSKITVMNKADRSLVQQTIFSQSYFGNSTANYRLRLDSISTIGSVGSDKPISYKFKYHSNIYELPRAYYDLTQNPQNPERTYSEDYWGYFNGAGGRSLIPSEVLTNIPSQGTYYATYYGADLAPNVVYSQMCQLNEVDLPTGGKTVFEFEPNQSNGVLMGGLRVKSISNFSGNGTEALTKVYAYPQFGLTSSTSNSLYHYLQKYIYLFRPDDPMHPNSLVSQESDKDVYSSNPSFPLTSLNQSSVVYNEITEYIGKDSLVGGGKTVYNYDIDQRNNWAYQDFDHPRDINYFHFDWGTLDPLLISKKDYKVLNGQFELIKRQINTYDLLKNDTLHTGITITQQGTYVVLGGYDPYRSAYEYVHDFIYSETQGYSYTKLLTQQEETEFGPNNSSISKTTSFQYDPIAFFPIKEQTTNSRNETYIHEMKYPLDFISQQPYNYMVNTKNMLSPVIEESFLKKESESQNTFLKGARTNYNFWTTSGWSSAQSNQILPQYLETKVGSGSWETRLLFNQYDNFSNVNEKQKNNDIKETYFWGYNSQFPVAKILNADFNTAKQFVSQTILNDATKTDAQMRSELNKLRTNLPTAQVTTYTYSPNRGMTSETDPRGRTTFYEYDGFGRLSVIRDHENNIVKNISYNYLSLPDNSIVTFYSHEKSQAFTPTVSCSTGGVVTPSSVTYTVPASKYISTTQESADQMAQADIDANGLNYANAHAGCLFLSAAISGSFTRSTCGPGYTTSPVTYIMPAGAYTSTVDQATADGQANANFASLGQAFANANGTCISSTVTVGVTNYTTGSTNVTFKFKNKTTNVTYTYTFSCSQSGASLGSIPTGNYDVTITTSDGSDRYFETDYYYQYGHSFTISNMQIDNNTNYQFYTY
jgi:YD repeat-containing protein